MKTAALQCSERLSAFRKPDARGLLCLSSFATPMVKALPQERTVKCRSIDPLQEITGKDQQNERTAGNGKTARIKISEK